MGFTERNYPDIRARLYAKLREINSKNSDATETFGTHEDDIFISIVEDLLNATASSSRTRLAAAHPNVSNVPGAWE